MILVNQFLKTVPKVYQFCGEDYLGVRPRAICKNGLNISIQAGKGYNSHPQTDCGPYTHVELGYPIYMPSIHNTLKFLKNLGSPFIESGILEYAENKSIPEKTVYKNVPIKVANKLIEKYGGIVGWEWVENNTIRIYKWGNTKRKKISIDSTKTISYNHGAN